MRIIPLLCFTEMIHAELLVISLQGVGNAWEKLLSPPLSLPRGKMCSFRTAPLKRQVSVKLVPLLWCQKGLQEDTCEWKRLEGSVMSLSLFWHTRQLFISSEMKRIFCMLSVRLLIAKLAMILNVPLYLVCSCFKKMQIEAAGEWGRADNYWDHSRWAGWEINPFLCLGNSTLWSWHLHWKEILCWAQCRISAQCNNNFQRRKRDFPQDCSRKWKG